MPVDPVRDVAVDVLLRIERKNMRIDDSLEKSMRRKGSALSSRGRRFLSQLVYGTVRHQGLCDRVYTPFLNQPANKLPEEIRVILRMGVFQTLFCNQVTFPAMVHTSVDLAKKRAHAGLAKVTNAVLRKIPQSLEEITFPDPKSDPEAHMIVRYSVPAWLATKWIAELGADGAIEVARASAEEAPLTARVNTAIMTVELLKEILAKQNVVVTEHPSIPGAVTLEGARRIVDSKPFILGHFVLQDLASMLPVHLLEPLRDEVIADLCCAPGTKTTQIAQFQASPKWPMYWYGHLLNYESAPSEAIELCSHLENPDANTIKRESFYRGYLSGELRAYFRDRDVETVDLRDYQVSSEVLNRVDSHMAWAFSFCPLKIEENVLSIATGDPTNQTIIDHLSAELDVTINSAFAPPIDVFDALERFYPVESKDSQLYRSEYKKASRHGVCHFVEASQRPRKASVFAIDLDRWRLERVVENAQRLDLSLIHI